jgi:hypothetical protein
MLKKFVLHLYKNRIKSVSLINRKVEDGEEKVIKELILKWEEERKEIDAVEKNLLDRRDLRRSIAPSTFDLEEDATITLAAPLFREASATPNPIPDVPPITRIV